MTIADLHAIATNATDTETTNRVRLEPNLRRVRVFVDGIAIADSTQSVYLFEKNHLPVYYFPIADVRFDLLQPTDHTSHCPFKGDATYWDIVVGGRRVENAVWGYPHPIDAVPEIAGYVAFYWDRVDAWFEEDDQVYVHARDPYKRIDVLQSSRHVEVKIDGVTVADTHRPRLLFETGLPVRYYIPKVDARLDLLRPSATVSACPYKGTASYYAVQLPDRLAEDIVWVYPSPIPEIPKIENHLCFYNEHVDIIVDGEPQPRPFTHWS